MRHATKSSALAALKAKGLAVPTILDIGISAGTPDLMIHFPKVTHLLFEPVAEFRANIERIYARIPHELFTVAVSDSDGETELAVKSVMEGVEITHARMHDGSGTNSAQARRVPMIALDSFMSRRSDPGPFLLKIDIDGDELKVLKGAENVLKQCAAVILELHTTDFFERSSVLLDRKFRLFDIVDLCYYDQGLAQVDGVFFNPAIMGDIDIIANFDIKLWQNERGILKQG